MKKQRRRPRKLCGRLLVTRIGEKAYCDRPVGHDGRHDYVHADLRHRHYFGVRLWVNQSDGERK